MSSHSGDEVFSPVTIILIVLGAFALLGIVLALLQTRRRLPLPPSPPPAQTPPPPDAPLKTGDSDVLSDDDFKK